MNCALAGSARVSAGSAFVPLDRVEPVRGLADDPPDQRQAIPAIKEGAPRGPWNPGHPARQPGSRYPRNLATRP
jgi:hypothetical protein